ncbi:MAG: hypothetical protein KAR85_07855 [Methanosarcinales archaeon]|nr:hypothetical protein [Methanosarcinales archaeon]
MAKTDEDIKLEKIGKYLELGGTMLAQHCECGAPLFRYHGNVVCPICDSNSSNNPDIIESRKKEKQGREISRQNESLLQANTSNTDNTLSGQAVPSITQQSISSPQQMLNSQAPKAPVSTAISSSSVPPISPKQASGYEATTKIISPETQEFISCTIINKVVQLCLDLQRENDLARVKQQMEAIKSGTKALKNLKKIN